MQFWLTFNNREDVLQLPVPPASFTIQKGTQINTVNINTVGEVAIIGKGLLATITLESFFPAKEYSFCQYTGFPEPYEIVKLIEKWKDSTRPIRLMITDTNINMACCIESFSYGEKDGTGDVYFSLQLKEYRFLNTDSSRPSDYQPPKTYTVKDGENAIVVAKKLFGDSSKAQYLLSKNNLLELQKGQVILT